jgi:hypothetical protein
MHEFFKEYIFTNLAKSIAKQLKMSSFQNNGTVPAKIIIYYET